eukprot:TRINITY_DN2849_c0_g1_i2.p1 TRINITY_DN2849_c0_g1~~TRINITY_DN2849_c0_g1_i2.p1  ORF type:complete len:874 (+),score=198.86 TRINITY_DN2849_c0_g1_i2:286-2907(+)
MTTLKKTILNHPILNVIFYMTLVLYFVNTENMSGDMAVTASPSWSNTTQDAERILIEFASPTSAAEFAQKYHLQLANSLPGGLFSFALERHTNLNWAEILIGDSSVSRFAIDKRVTLQNVPLIFGGSISVSLDLRVKRSCPDDYTGDTCALSRNPSFTQQWHLLNIGQNKAVTGEDMRGVRAFARGYSGKGVTIAIMDDGVETSHPEVNGKVDLNLSYDFVTDTNDASPKSTSDNHGTSVAGLAVGADNNVCGVGVAYGANMASIRVVGAGGITYSNLAAAFTHHSDKIAIYSNSWGNTSPFVDMDIDSLNSITKALRDTATNGRGGKGSAITFAAGNNRQQNANTNDDMLTCSPFTISVAASNDHQGSASYSTPGASVFVTAPSGDNYMGQLITADRSGFAGYGNTECAGFAGTSGSCPLVSGVIALLFEANPNLLYRDVMHIFSQTSDVIDFRNPEWQVNGAGRWVSHTYGFGRVNADRAIAAALSWVSVPAKKEVSVTGPQSGISISSSSTLTLDMTEDLFLEHVQVTVDISTSNRGALKIALLSPSGTASYLKMARNDVVSNLKWTFMSTQHWAESSLGQWQLYISGGSAKLNKWSMIFHGISRSSVPADLMGSQMILNSSNSVTHSCSESGKGPSCSPAATSKCVCLTNPQCCLIQWDDTCKSLAQSTSCPTSSPTPAPTTVKAPSTSAPISTRPPPVTAEAPTTTRAPTTRQTPVTEPPMTTRVPSTTAASTAATTASPASSAGKKCVVRMSSVSPSLTCSGKVTSAADSAATTGQSAVSGSVTTCTFTLPASSSSADVAFQYGDSFSKYRNFLRATLSGMSFQSVTSATYGQSVWGLPFQEYYVPDWSVQSGILVRAQFSISCQTL